MVFSALLLRQTREYYKLGIVSKLLLYKLK